MGGATQQNLQVDGAGRALRCCDWYVSLVRVDRSLRATRRMEWSTYYVLADIYARDRRVVAWGLLSGKTMAGHANATSDFNKNEGSSGRA